MAPRAAGDGVGPVSGPTATFFVATNGDDAWFGRAAEPNAGGTDGPFATLARARDAVRELKARGGLKAPVTVMVRGGKYFLDHTLVLGDEDSGTRECPITYTAYPGEEPILSGGRRLTGWEPYRGDILQCTVASARGGKWKFRQLFLNGERQPRACWPKPDPEDPRCTGWAFVEEPVGEGTASPLRPPGGYVLPTDKSVAALSASAFRYKPGTPKQHWSKPTEAEVRVFAANGSLPSIIPVKSVDDEGRVIVLRRDLQDVWQVDRSPGYAVIAFCANNRFRVENVLEELARPGEWCLDSEDGVVYFRPPAELTEEAEVVAPVLSCLVFLGGASWITLSGLTLTETLGGDDPTRTNQEGYGFMFPRPGLRYAGEALRMKFTEHCVIERNRFHAVGGNAVYLEGHNARNIIRRNEIGHSGAMGVCLAGRRDQGRHPIFNHIEHNDIHHCGSINPYVAGVLLALSDGNVITHNSIHHVPHHAICLGASGYGRNVIEYNEIRQTCLDIYDTGAINCWMEDPDDRCEKDAQRSGHVIRYNLIADACGCSVDEEGRIVAPCPMATSAIYLDNGSSNCFVYGNIVARAGRGITIHAGKNNIVENNVFIDCAYLIRYADYVSSRTPRMAGFLSGNRFCGNISYNTDPDALLMTFIPAAAWSERVVAESDHNLFFHAGGCDYVLWEASGKLGGGKETVPFADWQRLGYDTHSVLADPLFVDPEHDDYRLRPESPALKLGFRPIPIERIGVEGITPWQRRQQSE